MVCVMGSVCGVCQSVVCVGAARLTETESKSIWGAGTVGTQPNPLAYLAHAWTHIHICTHLPKLMPAESFLPKPLPFSTPGTWISGRHR